MASLNCPHCGKPLRPGVKFCGYCGKAVPATPGQPPQAAAPEMSTCPHCKKPVRVGAKFCNNCGKPINQRDSAAPVEKPAATPPVTLRQPQPAAAPAAKKTAVKPGSSNKKTARRAGIFLLAAIGVIACLAAIGGGFFYWRDPLGWFGRNATPSAMAVLPTTPATETMAATSPAASPPPETETPPAPPLPTETLLPTLEISPTQELSPTETLLTPTLPAPTPLTMLVILEDNFDGMLNQNWDVWGEPRPRVSSGPGDNWLELSVSDDPGSAGVTSKQLIMIDSGSEIIFTGQVNRTFPQYSLRLDWDPASMKRGPDYKQPGVLHVEIRRARLVLSSPLSRSTCEQDVTGTEQHVYRIRIVAGSGVELYVDDGSLPVCTLLTLGQPSAAGRITFSGTGWVTQVKAMMP